MKGFLQKGTLALLSLVWLMIIWAGDSAQAQTIKIPEDITLSCGATIPPKDPRVVQLIGGGSGSGCPPLSSSSCCSDKPLAQEDGCVVMTSGCLQVALVCVSRDANNYPIYRFKVYNACRQDLSNITFSLPNSWPVNGRVQVEIPVNGSFLNVHDGIEYKNCDWKFKVETPNGGPDEGKLKFEGKLPAGRSACFEYKLINPTVQNTVTVMGKLGQSLVSYNFTPSGCTSNTGGGSISKVDIYDNIKGSACSGQTIERTFTVYLAGVATPIVKVQKIVIPGDSQKPTGSCPSGRTGLSGIHQVPSPESRLAEVKGRYSDNCDADLTVRFFNKKETFSGCGGFTVTHIYEITDNCNNSSYCEISYSGGGGGGGSITGACPPGNAHLQCMSQVPSVDQLVAEIKSKFKGADGGPVWVQISTQKSTGNDCAGFWIKYLATITDNCGNSRTCEILYEGKDTTPPSGTCPSGKTNLSKPEDAPSANEYIWFFKEKWQDNCGGEIKVTHKPNEVVGGDCGDFKVIQRFTITDKCGNARECQIVHTGWKNGGNLVGNCPTGKDNLKCLSEVPSDAQIIELFKNAFQGEKEVKIIYRDVKGDDCQGFVVTIEVKVIAACGEDKVCWIKYSGKDNVAPTLKAWAKCPDGKTGLGNANQVPDPGQYLWSIKEAYQDNCGGTVYVDYVDREVKNGSCGEFEIIQRFKVYDKCWNVTYCYVTHKGAATGGSLVGNCPTGKDNLKCLSEVPSDANIIQLFQNAFQNEKEVKIIYRDVKGDDCQGFVVTIEVKVIGVCGDEKVCWIKYTGKDNVAPTLKAWAKCPDGKTGLGNANQVPDPGQYLWSIKEAYQDNCGGTVYVDYVDREVKNGSCGEFEIIQRFKVYDKCWNVTYCYVTHKGAATGGSLVGNCPTGKDNLKCLSEVPSNANIIQLFQNAFQNEKEVKIIYRDVKGDDCQGFVVTIEVKVIGVCGDEKVCWIKYTGKDNVAPTLKAWAKCPDGKTGLGHANQVPNPSQYLASIKEAYQDNCGGTVFVDYVDREVKNGSCGEFEIIQRFKVYDKCWNATYCYVTHKGAATGGSLVGNCPTGRNNLQCLSQVPSDANVVQLFQNAFQNEKEVKIIYRDVKGNECAGFEVTIEVKVIGVCGDEKICWIKYSGKDTTAPVLKSGAKCPSGKTGLSHVNQAPDPNQYLSTIRNAYIDNCNGNVKVEYVDRETKGGNCGEFEIIQRFRVSDNCGNFTFCFVSHTGSGNTGGLSGDCPTGKDKLQCISQVPSNSEVLELVRASFQGEKDAQIVYRDVKGDNCGGFLVTIEVKVIGVCGEEKLCWIKYSGKDTTAPVARPGAGCPDGKSGLGNINEVPNPSQYLSTIRNAYLDNCGGTIRVEYVDREVKNGSCGAFEVIQRFRISDNCGNSTFCFVRHSGAADGGSLTGNCPAGKENLKCVSEAPSDANVIQLFRNAFQNEKEVKIIYRDVKSKDCNFEVTIEVLITGVCNDTKTCWIKYSGKDNVAPTFTSTPPSLVIGCDESPTFQTPVATDNCGEATVKRVGDDLIVEGSCDASYSVIRTWVAVDACGNVSEPVSQTITISGDCCGQVEVCAYTPFYWGQHREKGEPNVKDILEANGGKITIGTYDLDLDCIDVLLPGQPLALPDSLEKYCPNGLISTSQIRHTIALTLNVLNAPALCNVRLKNLPCPVDYQQWGFDETSTVCDLLEAANVAIKNEWFDCELADLLAAVNECFDCSCPEKDDDDEDNNIMDSGNRISPKAPAALEQEKTLAPEITMEAFPNPSSGLVNIKLDGFGQERVFLFLLSNSGEVLHRLTVPEGAPNQVSLDLASGLKLTSGAYFITASSGQKTVSRKLILENKR